MARLFAAISQQVSAAVARGETEQQARKNINLTEMKNSFAGNSQIRKEIFDSYVTGPAISAAFADASPAKP